MDPHEGVISPRSAATPGSKIVKLPSGAPPTPGSKLPGLASALPPPIKVPGSPVLPNAVTGPETGSRRGLAPLGSARDTSQKEIEQLKTEKHMLKEEISTMQALAEQLALEEKSLRDKVDALTRDGDRLQSIVDKLHREKVVLEQTNISLQQSNTQLQHSSPQLQLPQPSQVRPASGQGRSMRVAPDSLRGLKRSDLPPQPTSVPTPSPSNGVDPSPNVPQMRKVGFW